MGARFSERWQLALPLLLPALGGLGYLYAFGAPARLIAVNAGALVLALVWVLFGRLPSGHKARLGLAAAALAGLFLPPLLHHEVDGVSRWLPAWPFLLHSGALLLPLLTVIAAREPRAAPWLLALAMVALSLQPDAGTLIALAAASAALAWSQRSKAMTLIAGASLTLALVTWQAGALAPQEFTEGVLAQVWQSSPPFAAGLAGLMFIVPWLLVAGAGQLMRAERAALSALLTGLGIAALIGPFPFPLIGYGASPILGFGLALSALGRLSPGTASR